MEMGSSSSLSDSLNGLKFGQKIYFEDVGFGAPAKSGGGSSSSSTASVASGKPSPTKKGKSGVVQARCQVEGCKVDLSDAKAYYSRHKVCGTHSKSPVVTVAGLEQRFCQQCSRFHQLPEFDQGKRSCRRRLAGHNERRRKPPPGSLSSSRYGRLSSSIFETSKDGGFVMDFSTFPRFTGRDQWPTTRASSDQVSGNQSTPTGKFFSPPWPSQPETPPPSDLFLQGSTSETHYSGSTIPSGECFSGASDSVCALSLLSNQPWGQRSRPTSLGVNQFTLNADHDASMVQSASTHGSSVNHFSSPPWGFKGHGVGTGSHDMAPELGLSHISHSGNNPYSSEFELTEQTGRQYAMELEHSREPYGSFSQHTHWSL